MSIMDKDDLVWEALKNPEAYQKWQQEVYEKIKQAEKEANFDEMVKELHKKK